MSQLNLPTLLWLSAAFLSFLASVGCWFFVDKPTGLYIGLWVPSILALGCLLTALRRGRFEEQTARVNASTEQPRQAR